MWKIWSEDRQKVMEFSKRAHSCVENSVYIYLRPGWKKYRYLLLFCGADGGRWKSCKNILLLPRYFVSIRLYSFLAPADSISFIFVANFESFSGSLFHNSRAFPRYKIKLRGFYRLVENPQWVMASCRRLVACLCPERSDFDPRPVPVEFAVGNVALGQCYFA